MKNILSVFVSTLLVASLALAGVGCAGMFTGEVPAPAAESRFVALAGTTLPDVPIDEESAEEESLEEPAETPDEAESVTDEFAAPLLDASPEPSLGLSVKDLLATPAPQGSSASENEAYLSDDFYTELPGEFAHNTEEYASLDEHGFFNVATSPLSTFSADVDTASYANLRRMINGGVKLKDIPSGAIRIEEMLNYFHYDFITPNEGEPFSLNAQVADCPWNPDSRLMVLGIQAQEPPQAQSGAGSNLVFLIDTSGSMNDNDKLPLLIRSFAILADQLTEADTVSMVTYAGSVQVVLDGAQGNERSAILNALDRLQAGGSTYGEGGLDLAYQLAEEHFIEDGNNRIIMASDGDLNVGISSESALNSYVSEKQKTGIYLSVFGFGTGNFKDNKMETLADNGNGNYHYIDSLDEARKVFVDDLTSNLYAVADDVKLQLEFNPAYIKGYRQIGYVNRSLDDADFLDDTKDAAEMGAGHQVIVVYEIVMADAPFEIGGDALKYQEDSAGVENGEWLTIALRYKDPGAPVSKGIEYTLDESAYTTEPDADWIFVSVVVEFGLIASQSDYAGTSSLAEAIARAEASHKDYADRQEFIALAKRLYG